MIINDLTTVFAIFTALAFLVNIIVGLTKAYVPIPTKLWCIAVSAIVIVAMYLLLCSIYSFKVSLLHIAVCIFASFLLAFVSMYGFDTFKELWKRFKKGENINE